MKPIITRLLPCLIAAVLLAGCGTIEKDKRRISLEAALNRYGDAIRWGYYGPAFELVRPEKRGAVPPNLENIQVTGYDVEQPPVPADENTVIQVVRIDYVQRDRQLMRTIHDRQQWGYDLETNTWWLDSGLPAFK